MKLKLKLALLALGGSLLVVQFGGCARFLGDFVGDRIFLSLWD
jgi:hypothetical protein